MENKKLQIQGVSKSFAIDKGTMPVLENISLAVHPGEFVSIIGPSGSGKSTLLDLLAGLSRPDHGQILLDGDSIAGKRGHVSYMPQKDVLFPWRTVLQNVVIASEIQGVRSRDAMEEARKLLPVFGLEGFGDSYPHMLSGGMRQRAAFLRTYLSKKDLMVLDEPFGKLDALTRLQMQQWLTAMWQTFNNSVLMVTHDVDEAILLSDRIYILSSRPGRVIAEMKVPLDRPRNKWKSTDPVFVKVKEGLMRLLADGNG